jgi:DNA-binding NtrC family response regulator
MPTTPRILCLQTAPARGAAEHAARAAGVDMVSVASVTELLRALAGGTWAATVLSLSAEHVDDTVARRIGAEPQAGPLLLTAPAVSLERAMLAERVGAIGILREPIGEEDLRSRLSALLDEGPTVPLPAIPPASDKATPTLVGEDPVMATVFGTVARAAGSDSTVLITGESGTGKEVIAKALHAASGRARGPFVAVNCAAIPENLLESELFGHERGAFTGAVAKRIGRFERADGGTLFLDEIGDMSLVLQAKVLRVLEERVVERVGGETSDRIDVRVVAATNQDLSIATAEGRFREDLFYRLAVVEAHLPPLRSRGTDIRRLALHFGAVFAAKHGKPVKAVSERALRRLEEATWPGNVRELRNVMDRAVLLAHGDVLRVGDLRLGEASPRVSAKAAHEEASGYAPELSLEAVEAHHIQRVLAAVGGHVAQAAASLGIHRNTLSRKMRQYGIEPSTGAQEPA